MGERTRELTFLILGDLILFIGALWLTLLVRYFSLPSEPLFLLHFWPFLFLSLVWIAVFYIGSLYDKQTLFLKSRLGQRILTVQGVNALIAVLFFLVAPVGIEPKTNLVIYFIIASGLLWWWRIHLFALLSPRQLHNALLVASGEEARELMREVNGNERYTYTFLKLVDDTLPLSSQEVQELLRTMERKSISVVVANPRGVAMEVLFPLLFERSLIKRQTVFLDFHNVYEDTFDKVPLSSLDYQWFLENIPRNSQALYGTLKRLIDIVGSILIGAVFLLLLPFIYIAMRIEGSGPIFIRQDRVGQFNTRMQVHKLRTMTAHNAVSGIWTNQEAALGNRITRVGALLRRLSIDEFPQVFDVLRGEMSLIGPRNDMVGFERQLAEEIPYHNVRNLVKPGITGWAQTHQHYKGDNISPQSIEESRERFSYDLYYVKNRSLLLDISIALRTIKILLARAYSIARF